MKRQLKTAILCVLLFLFLVGSNCTYYRPELYPIVDVLRPDESVKIIGITEDGNVIVNKEFMLWVESLKDEIIRLRAELEKERN